MTNPQVGQIRGLRIQVIGYDQQDETGLKWGYIFEPTEGTPAVWNGKEWIELTRRGTND